LAVCAGSGADASSIRGRDYKINYTPGLRVLQAGVVVPPPAVLGFGVGVAGGIVLEIWAQNASNADVASTTSCALGQSLAAKLDIVYTASE